MHIDQPPGLTGFAGVQQDVAGVHVGVGQAGVVQGRKKSGKFDRHFPALGHTE